jgi:hypothetical protein
MLPLLGRQEFVTDYPMPSSRGSGKARRGGRGENDVLIVLCATLVYIFTKIEK